MFAYHLPSWEKVWYSVELKVLYPLIHVICSKQRGLYEPADMERVEVNCVPAYLPVGVVT